MNLRISDQKRRAKLIQAQQLSGLSVEKFCREKKICKTSFYAWRKHIEMTKRPATPSLSAAEPESNNGLTGSLTKGFMRLMPPAKELAIRIETANGYKVDTGYAGEDGLKDVLRVLQAL